ncbi:neuronal acetylcholine receptor subunit alpha-10-like isoform X1 [Aplysia californica]|uniref:Neuronal acetylcholine receptor subunit alpha-10-like isoform X1 n=1 Tax=Aplysia californica TaxID=6500 RepID=A0ABM1A355_APLCA|nr:neuronal acetylcholine receptor subunit alpha-10-like isoform X1 [Aplysia californica]
MAVLTLRCCKAVFVLVFMVLIFSQQCEGQPTLSGGREVWHEEELIKHLLNGYVKEARPVLKPEDTVEVSVKFSFVRVEDLDEATDTFASSVFIVQVWTDPRLKWDLSKYGGVHTVRLPASKIWIPDLVLYNVAHREPPSSLYEETVTVTSDGSVVWVPMLTLYSTCPMDLSNFPYDVQTCRIVFGSWMHTSWEMNVTFISKEKAEMDVVLSEEDSSYLVHQHPQWELVGNRAKARLTLKKYDCCQQPFTLITISVQLRRRSQFYRYLTLGPAAVLGILVPVVFLVPARSQDKTTFGLLLLLTLTVLMSILQQAVPFNHGSMPRICSFYLGTMILTSISVVASVIVANICVRGARRKPVPAWAHSLFLGRGSLRRFLCIGDFGPVRNLYSSDISANAAASGIHLADLSRGEGNEPTLQEVEGEGLWWVTDQLLNNSADGSSESPATSGSAEDKKWSQLACYVKFIVGKMAADSAYENANQEWEELGRVIDRLLFIAFFALYVFTAAALL